jgi:hypothetical protein
MPDKKRPSNIFDVINQNIYAVSEDLHTLMAAIDTMRDEFHRVRAMFNAPDQPNAPGETSATE